jgi:hypothetical protein
VFTFKVDREFEAILKILNRANHPTFPVKSCTAAFTNPRFPGRVFVEAPTLQQVYMAIDGVGELSARGITLVPPADREQTLAIKASNAALARQSWVRFGSNNPLGIGYHGDIGLVTSIDIDGTLQISFVPRIPIAVVKGKGKASKKLKRPLKASRKLFDPTWVRNQYGEGAVKNSDDPPGYIFDGRLYDSEGFGVTWQVMLEHVILPAFPTAEELKDFMDRSWVDEDTKSAAKEHINIALLAHGNRVKVIKGNLVGLIGVVEAVGENEVTIRIGDKALEELNRSQGLWGPQITEGVFELGRDFVRRRFEAGDAVEVISGASKGTSGWVVNQVLDMLHIVTNSLETEVGGFRDIVMKSLTP